MPQPLAILLPLSSPDAPADDASGEWAVKEDAALCEAALAGSNAAWNQLIARHDGAVRRKLLALGLPLHIAEEVAQETWSTLILRARQGTFTHLELPGLARRQATFLGLDALRRAAVQRPRELPWEAEEVAALISAAEQRQHEDDSSRMERAEQDAQLWRAVRNLPPNMQEVVAMYYQEELNAPQIAARRGISEQRVRDVLCEARRRLRAALGVSS